MWGLEATFPFNLTSTAAAENITREHHRLINKNPTADNLADFLTSFTLQKCLLTIDNEGEVELFLYI